MRARGAGFLSLLGIAAGGCSLLISTSDLVGNGPRSDGGVATDGAHDLDGARESDVDATSREGGGGLGWCASRAPVPTFCADFDRGAIDDGWDSTKIAGGGAVSLTSDAGAPSPLRAMLSTVPRAATAQSDAYLAKGLVIPASAKSLRCGFELLPIALGTLDDEQVLQMEWQAPASTNYRVRFEVSATRMEVSEIVPTPDGGATTTNTIAVSSPVMGRWTRIVIAIDLATSKVDVSMGGQIVRSGASLASAPYQRFPFGIKLGFDDLVPGEDWSAAFDNVECLIE